MTPIEVLAAVIAGSVLGICIGLIILLIGTTK